MKQANVKHRQLKITLIVIACILINFTGKMFSEQLRLPFWFDSIGTVAAAYILGPVCGGMVGFAVNAMYASFSIDALFYVGTNVLVGVVTGVLSKRGVFEKVFSAFSLSMFIALVSTVASVPINVIFWNGMTGNMWGDAIINYTSEIGIPRYIGSILGEYCIDLTDKIISVFIVYLGIRIVRKSSANAIKKATSVIILMALTAGLLQNISVNVFASESDEAEKINFSSYIQTVYNAEDGILGGEVNDIAQTLDGMIWVGTYGGLYQYDGNSFNFMSNFDSVRNVNCLFTDGEGRLWIGTNDCGLSICSNNVITNVLDDETGLSANSVRSIAQSSEGYYFVGTVGALNIVVLTDGMNVEFVYDELNYVSSMVADDNGHVCAVDSQGRLGLFHGKDLIKIYENNPDGSSFTSVNFDENGFLYAGINDGSFEKYAITNDELVFVESYDGNGLTTINNVYKNSNGDIFICADNGIGYKSANGKVEIVNTNDFNSSIDNMLVDYQGNMWFSSSRLGLLEMRASIFEEVFARIGLDEKVVNSVTLWNDKYYFGTDSGLVVANSGLDAKASSSIESVFDSVRIRCLMVDKNNRLWVSTSGKGVYVFEESGDFTVYTANEGIAGDKTRATIECEDGTVAVATDNGVSLIRNGAIVKSFGTDDGMTIERTLTIEEWNGELYLGTDGGGIAVVSDNAVTKIISKNDGLSSDIVLRIVKTSAGDGLFVITSNGICFVNEDGEVRQLNQFPYYNNFDIIKAGDGKLWITSSAGIYVVDEQQFINGEDVDYELLDSRKGLSAGLVANSWNYCDGKGSIVLCGDTGAISINSAEYNNTHASYRIMLESIIIDGVVASIDKEEINTIGRDAVRVEFCPKVINYSVNDPYVSIWLEGFDEEPRIVLQSELENVVYTNLKSGEYTFHIAILDGKQEKELEKVSYSFVKEMEIYDNWWFEIYLFGIVSIIIIYVVWLIVGNQVNKSMQIQKAEIENMRLKQAADAAMAANEAKDSFLALMSHDIRTPINAILGMNEMILRESKDDNIYSYATDIKGAGDTLLSLVNTILDFSKIEQGKMEIIPANYETKTLINNLVNGVRERAKEKGLDFIVYIDDKIPSELYGDDIRVNQVISNLLTNAIKYTPKGFVRFTLRVIQIIEDRLYLYCEVCDSGIGIKETDMEKLFESFQRLDEQKNRNIEGTGLGMAIVTNLLKMMNSHLDVKSFYGEGSTFSFVLEQKIVSHTPIGNYQTSAVSGVKETKKHLYAPSAKILVVDDNDMNLKVAENLLKINGIKPDLANSGKVAISKAEKKQYDIIFMDHMMPEMDGFETLEYMKRHGIIFENTKVIVVTANAINGAKEQYLKNGFDDYISKPIEPEKLEGRLKKYLPESIIVNEDNDITEDSTEKQPEYDNDADKISAMCKDIDYQTGLSYSMESWDFYKDMLATFVEDFHSSDKVNTLSGYLKEKDINNYQILVHSIKSNTLSIGAGGISEKAKALEFAAKEGNEEFINENHEELVNCLIKLVSDIEEFLK